MVSEADSTARRQPRRRVTSPHLSVDIDVATIDNSVRRDSSHCMIAEAIKGQLPEAKNISVDLGSIRWTDPKKRLRYIYLTPRSAQIALIDFDRGIKPAPFHFNLRRASQVMRGGFSGHNNAPKTPEARRAAAKQTRHLRRTSEAQDADQPFTPSNERREEVVRAMADPHAPLGPAISLQGSYETTVPTIVGGKAPPPGNLARTRKFGLRLLHE